jgi:hypothetical protein
MPSLNVKARIAGLFYLLTIVTGSLALAVAARNQPQSTLRSQSHIASAYSAISAAKHRASVRERFLLSCFYRVERSFPVSDWASRVATST